MSDKNISVTVALSVYNVERYLRQSLDCIVNQTYKNLEILCIDDCSTDGTYAILEEYATRDSRFRLIRQERNQGLSVSRNRAIAEARGKYIIMLDGDDLFDSTMIEKAYNMAESEQADMVLWDYCVFYNEKEIKALLKLPSALERIDKTDKIALLRRPGFMWVRMLRVETIKNMALQFPKGLTKQDIPVHWQLVTLLPDNKIALLPEKLAYYRQTGTNTTSRKGKSLFALAYVMDIVDDFLHKNNLYEVYKNEFLRSRLSLLHGMYDAIKLEYKAEAKSMILERLTSEAYDYINSPACALSRRNILFYKGYFLGNMFAKLQYDGVMLARAIYRKIK